MESNREWLIYKDEKRKLSKQKENLMQGETIWFECGEWKEKNLGRACLLIKRWYVRQLLIMKTENREMIREIVNIKFPHLVYISLQQNNIESIEGLSRVRFPHLKQLHLDENQITKVKNMRKIRCKKLNDIKINHNMVMDCQEFTKLKTDCEIKELHIEQIWDSQMGSDLRWLVKLKSSKMQDLYIGSRKRIRQQAFLKCLKKRFYKIHKVQVKDTE